MLETVVTVEEEKKQKAVDFGMLENGKIELIESHHPFACGWYGKNHEEYAKFLTLGWKWINDTGHKESF